MHELVDGLDRVASDPFLLYTWCKRIDNYPGRGTFPVVGRRVVTYAGLRERQFFYEPLSSYDTILRAALLTGRLASAHCRPQYLDRLQISFQVFRGAHAAPSGWIDLPKPGEQLIGGHAVRVVGWAEDGDRLVFANSWGPGWGERGFGSVGRDYLDRYLDEAWLARNARYGLSPASWRQLSTATNDAQFVRAWMTENPRRHSVVRLGRRRLRLTTYSSLSIDHDCRAEVAELRIESGLRAGWAILFHLGGSSRTTIVKEFFVWPPWRRRGYGTLLESTIVGLARRAGSSHLEVLLLGVDGLPRSRAAGRTFAQSAGYIWRWRLGRRPDVAGVAMKPI